MILAAGSDHPQSEVFDSAASLHITSFSPDAGAPYPWVLGRTRKPVNNTAHVLRTTWNTRLLILQMDNTHKDITQNPLKAVMATNHASGVFETTVTETGKAACCDLTCGVTPKDSFTVSFEINYRTFCGTPEPYAFAGHCRI